MQKDSQSSEPNKIATFFVVIGIIFILSVVVLGSRSKDNVPGNEASIKDGDVAVRSSINSENESVILFYGITCPHCADVEEWIEQNDVDEKITIERKEVYENSKNARELTSAAGDCGLNTNSIGVPFLYAEGNCYMGIPDIVGYISDRVDTTVQESSE